MMDAASITAIGLIFTGLVTLFIKSASDARKSQEKREDENRKSQESRDKIFAEALVALTKSNEKIAEEAAKSRKVHVKGLAEAEKRNGHLADISVQQGDRVIDAIQTIKSQHVKTQVVDEQTIKKKESK